MSTDATVSRPLPQDSDTERALLGAILINNELLNQVGDKLGEDDFFSEQHRRIYSRMVAMFQKSQPVDVLTLKDALDSLGLREPIALSYLASLTDGVPRLHNVTEYAEIIKRKSVLRKLIQASHDIIDLGYTDEGDVMDLLKQAETRIFDISQSFIKKNYIPLTDALVGAYDTLSHRFQAKDESLTGIGSGFRELDKLTCGLQRGELIIIAARPSMGKTTLALNIAVNAALKEDCCVGFFSLEMSARQLAFRVISAEAKIDGLKIRSGYFSNADWGRIGEAVARLDKAKIFIDDTSNLSVLELQTKARRLARENRLGLVVVDYLQLMTADTRRRIESRVLEIGEITRSLKALAKDLDVPVVALSQLSRAPEARKGDHRPILADLRESGSIEQDADVVIFIYREEFYHKDDPTLENKAQIILEKQRNGPTGNLELAFLKQFSLFGEIAPKEWKPSEPSAASSEKV